MSTTESTSDDGALTVIFDQEANTVTFAPDQPEELPVPATEWMTVAADDLILLEDMR